MRAWNLDTAELSSEVVLGVDEVVCLERAAAKNICLSIVRNGERSPLKLDKTERSKRDGGQGAMERDIFANIYIYDVVYILLLREEVHTRQERFSAKMP